VSVLEARLKRAIRPKDRLWAMIRLAERLEGKEAQQTEQAISLFTEAERLAESIKDRRGAAAAIHGIGRCQLRLYKIAPALETLARALPIAEQSGDAECEILILRDIGVVYAIQSRHDLALETLKKCAELAELIGNIQVQASALNQIGSVFNNLGQYQEAIVYHTRSLALFEGAGWTQDQANILLSLSNALRHLGKYKEALSALDRSRELCPDDANQGYCQGSIGLIYSEIGDYPNALSYLFASATILEHVGDKLNLAGAYTNLMQVYLQLGNIAQATDCGKRALVVFEEIGHKPGQAVIYNNLGKQYIEQGEKTKALRMLKQCLALSREINSKSNEISALSLLAKLEIGRGNWKTSEKLFRNALDIASSVGDQDGVIVALLGLGSLFNRLGELEQAIVILDRAIEIAGKIHSRRHEQEAHQMLAEIFEACETANHAGSTMSEGNLKRALIHSKLASSIKEDILGVEKQKAITKLQIRLGIEKSEIETELLRKEKRAQAWEIERTTLAIAKKTEQIRSVGRRIRKIMAGRVGSLHSFHEFDGLLSELEEGYSIGGEKTIFDNEFQLVHRDVLQILSTNYPALTSTESKICVLLFDGLSTKEVANMMKVSTHVINNHRYEIRNKMKLKRGENLTAVLERMRMDGSRGFNS
jgi:tetratricopeptide (TPR) repeat protein/DNA-binding CsgD family transcriptional regulator